MVKVIPFYYDDDDDLFANTYIVIDDRNQCIVIDPSKDCPGIVNYIKKNNLILKGILLTHGHFDHIRGVNNLYEEFHTPIYIGFEEVDLLTNPELNCSYMMSSPYIIDIKPITISDNEVIHLLDENIVCIHTPFHTVGSYCYLFKESKILFTGDSLFKGSVGRSDLPTGNIKDFPSSMAKIKALDDDLKIFPGHGPSSNLAFEKRANIYLMNYK